MGNDQSFSTYAKAIWTSIYDVPWACAVPSARENAQQRLKASWIACRRAAQMILTYADQTTSLNPCRWFRFLTSRATSTKLKAHQNNALFETNPKIILNRRRESILTKFTSTLSSGGASLYALKIDRARARVRRTSPSSTSNSRSSITFSTISQLHVRVVVQWLLKRADSVFIWTKTPSK